MKTCIYHGTDLDGHCSAAIWLKAHAGCDDDLNLVRGVYGQPLNPHDFAGHEVAVLDFSLEPWDQMLALFGEVKSLLWIDHHVSAIKRWGTSELVPRPHVTTVLDVKYAACELAWKYYFPAVEIPASVDLLGRYDVWDHSDPDVLPYQYGMRRYDLDPCRGKDAGMWEFLLSGPADPASCIVTGAEIKLYQDRCDEQVAQSWHVVDFAGKRWQAINARGGSRLFDSIRDKAQYHGMLTYQFAHGGWTISLYTDREDVDCSAIATKHGGGGHRGAAGFPCSELPFSLTG